MFVIYFFLIALTSFAGVSAATPSISKEHLAEIVKKAEKKHPDDYTGQQKEIETEMRKHAVNQAFAKLHEKYDSSVPPEVFEEILAEINKLSPSVLTNVSGMPWIECQIEYYLNKQLFVKSLDNPNEFLYDHFDNMDGKQYRHAIPKNIRAEIISRVEKRKDGPKYEKQASQIIFELNLYCSKQELIKSFEDEKRMREKLGFRVPKEIILDIVARAEKKHPDNYNSQALEIKSEMWNFTKKLELLEAHSG